MVATWLSRAVQLTSSPGDRNGSLDVFVHDLVERITRRVSVDSGGVEGDGDSGNVGLVDLGATVATLPSGVKRTNLVWLRTRTEKAGRLPPRSSRRG
jgi:hypothetical protein